MAARALNKTAWAALKSRLAGDEEESSDDDDEAERDTPAA